MSLVTNIDDSQRMIRIATRASKLALWQAESVKARLVATHPALRVDIVPITTTGDRVSDRPLHEIDGKALFIKELEECLAHGEADIAVHCMKDFHSFVPTGFDLPVVMTRACELDALLTNQPCPGINHLPRNSTVGTTSLRRTYSLKKARPDLSFRPLRGNIDSRLRRLEAGEYDAIVLANAGLFRLGIQHPHVHLLSHAEMLPAVGQGALGVETRSGDHRTIDLIKFLDDSITHAAVDAERAFVKALGASCKSAVGCHAQVREDLLILRGIVGNVDLMLDVSGVNHGNIRNPDRVGRDLACMLLGFGADRLLASVPNNSELKRP